MSDVIDSIGRTFRFDTIRFKMDDDLLQQAALEVLDQSKKRRQFVFERYCRLHFQKYRRNYEPSHFANGRLKPDLQHMYDKAAPTLRLTVDISSGDLFDRYVGIPVSEIEAAIQRDPRTWVKAGRVIATSG